MADVIKMRGAREAPKSARSRMETMLLTPEVVQEWRIPPFQRPLKVNAKVLEIADGLKTDPFIEGVISLGTMGADSKTLYLVDGQHRIEAAKISGVGEFIADVRICPFDTFADMAIEFARINTQIHRLRPDDLLRALEGSTPPLKLIRSKCPFVGYDQIRRGGSNTPVLSMSAALRCWMASGGDTPSVSVTGGHGAAGLAKLITLDEAQAMVEMLTVARAAWGFDPENYRLWGNLNLSLTMWLWRQLVTKQENTKARTTRLDIDQFKRCLMHVSANRDYIDWLVGRQMNDRDRSPAYMRIKAGFIERLKLDRYENPKLPAPEWASR